MSNISSMFSSPLRMTGMSGIDVDSIVKQLMSIEQAKVDKAAQARQAIVWQQEKYRSVTSALQGFSSTYFDSLNSMMDMRSVTAYSAFGFKYDGADTSSYFSVTSGSGVNAGEYTIKNIQTALSAKITGSAATGNMTGTALPVAGVDAISAAADNNRIKVTFNGTTKEIVLKDVVLNGNPAGISQLAQDLNDKLEAAFGSGKITVGESSGKLTFTTSGTNTLSLSNTVNSGYNSIFGKDLSGGLTVNPADYRFKITLGSTVKEFKLPAGASYVNTDEVVAAIQDLVDNDTDGFGNGKITVKNVNNMVVLEAVDTSVQVSASEVESGGLAALGFGSANVSNKINLNAKLFDIQKNFENELTLSGNEKDISFVINGQTFEFNSKETSLNQIISAVNSNVAANVKMRYDSMNDKFILESKDTGVTAAITVEDGAGGLIGSLSLLPKDESGNPIAAAKGRDASITFNDGVNGDQVVTRSTNIITAGGMTFNLTKDYSGAVDLSVRSDPSKAVDMIKGFVAKYNELLDLIDKEVSAEKNYDYFAPTDAEKEQLTENQLKLWEDKAKSGLLSNDPLLRSIVTSLRNALSDAVEGAGLTLREIGIDSKSWRDKGKLYIDENKLKNALSEKPNQIIELFTKVSSVSYSDAAKDPAKGAERHKESGLIARLYDVIQDNIRTTTINGRRGALLEKAGMPGDRSQLNNFLYEQISAYDEKLDKLYAEMQLKEESYYTQFARLETLISSMNAQSNWLASQFQ